MPPSRTNSANAGRNARPFKPPTRVSSASSNSATIRKSNASKNTAGRPSNAGSSKSTNLNASDEDDEVEASGSDEEDVETSRVTTSAVNRAKGRISGAAAPTTPRRRSTAVAAGAEDDPLALIEDDDEAPVIPRPLLTRILHHGFSDKNVKISKEAMSVVELYTRIFVKEAMARSKQENKSQTGNTDMDTVWLQVEDLEKIAPQLLLDF
jgi:CENP-S associating centromere protein X